MRYGHVSHGCRDWVGAAEYLGKFYRTAVLDRIELGLDYVEIKLKRSFIVYKQYFTQFLLCLLNAARSLSEARLD